MHFTSIKNTVYDHVLSHRKRLRLNHYNRKVEISYYPDSNSFIPTPKRADVRLSFKNVYGDQIGKPLTNYPEKIKRREDFNILNFELNPAYLQSSHIAHVCFRNTAPLITLNLIRIHILKFSKFEPFR
ncbi:MAG: hypothetical protein GH151_13930 [Bacteroidetes bacterium]|nr:hypothetical protein [Bacteroidota bacterium]